ncbi:thio(seleno)oxazole modification radical SAM maturase SbtM [bacterium]
MRPIIQHEKIKQIYPITCLFMKEDFLEQAGDNFLDFIKISIQKNLLPTFLSDLSFCEFTKFQVSNYSEQIPAESINYLLNSSLELVKTKWKISPLFYSKDLLNISISNGEEWILIWKNYKGLVNIKKATDSELLAIKLIAEDMDFEIVSEDMGISVYQIKKILKDAMDLNIIIGPHSNIKRDKSIFSDEIEIKDEFIYSNFFSIQWHITNACDLKCKHCYDRTKRSNLSLEQGYKIIDDLVEFCVTKNVKGHVCFTGGNPFLSKDFFEFYQYATDQGFTTSILGNPVSKDLLEKLFNIQKPQYFQVSLEGLREHNDFIRGEDHFDNVMGFLDVLKKFDCSSAVMLTLTKENIDQVLNLAEILKHKADHFTFNRLSMVGEGANLYLPSKEEYKAFLNKYIDAVSNEYQNLGFKDNLINIELRNKGLQLFDGCTGFGCGAAFNFVAVLPDGEAHACRKFPSKIGNVFENSIKEIYDSELANKYRKGFESCNKCIIRHVCGGCLSTAYNSEQDITEGRDPYCFY